MSKQAQQFDCSIGAVRSCYGLPAELKHDVVPVTALNFLSLVKNEPVRAEQKGDMAQR